MTTRPARVGALRPGAVVLLALLLAALGACRVGPDYRTPDVPADIAAPFTSLQATGQSPAAPPDPWWRLYDDPRLDALVLEALQANRTLAAADANFAAARAVLATVHASRTPSTDISVGGLRGRDAATDEILELGGHAPQTIWLYEDVFRAAYEVDVFGRVHRSIEAAAANADAVGAARDAVRVVVAAEAARGYAAICALGEQLAVARQSYEVVAHEAEIARRRHDAGANSVFDVTRAEGLAAQAQASIPLLEGQRRVALFALAAVLGRAPQAAPTELESCTAPPHLLAMLPVGDGAALIQRRPDVRQAERRLAAATAQIGVATADLYPSIRLVGLYGGVATEVSALDTNLGRTWGLGPAISWNFPNQALPRARVRQAKAQQAAALAAFDAVVLTALEEVEQALSNYGAALENRAALAAARDKTHAAYGIAHAEFAAGAVSTLDLLTTEASLVALDTSVAAADATLIQDQIAVFKALGGGWRDASQSR